jgi:hypothetical protein
MARVDDINWVAWALIKSDIRKSITSRDSIPNSWLQSIRKFQANRGTLRQAGAHVSEPLSIIRPLLGLLKTILYRDIGLRQFFVRSSEGAEVKFSRLEVLKAKGES